MSTYREAHTLGELREFAGWREPDGDLDAGTICFLGDDLVVRRAPIDPDTVLFETGDAAWAGFCRDVLGFAPPAFDRPSCSAEPVAGGPRVVPFTSGQRWQLDEREAAHPRRFTLRTVLPVDDPMEPRAVEHALALLLERHDALRLRLDRHGDRWVQAVSESPGLPLTWLRLTALAPEARAAARKAAVLEACILVYRLRSPMVQAIYLEGGAQDGTDALVVVLDHFVGDGMALAVVTSDLRRLLRRTAAGEGSDLTPVPQFARWARRVAEHVASPEVEREIDEYWLRLPWDHVVPLPFDFPDGVEVAASSGRPGFGPQGSEHVVTGMLDVEETDRFSARTKGREYEPDDLLLTALAVALAGHTGSPVQFVMDNHMNRYPAFDGLDMSRVVACVSGARRMVLDLRGAGTAEEALRAVHGQLRAMPNLGRTLEWVVRRGDGLPVPERLRPVAGPADVTFLYNGRLDRWVAAGVGGGLGESMPELDRLSDRGPRPHPLNSNAVIDLEGRLRVDIGYSDRLHRRETIEALMERCLACLRELCAPSAVELGRR